MDFLQTKRIITTVCSLGDLMVNRNCSYAFTYHGVLDGHTGSSNELTFNELEGQLTKLDELGVLDRHSTIDTIKRPTVLIMFDDAQSSFYEAFMKVLQHFPTLVHLFVPTNLINRKGFLSVDQLRQLQEFGVLIYSHGHSHIRLGNDVSGVEKDVEKSIEWLERNLTSSNFRKLFAYPWGYYTDLSVRVMHRLRFQFCRGARFGRLDFRYPYQLRTVMVDRRMSLQDIKGIVEGRWSALDHFNAARDRLISASYGI